MKKIAVIGANGYIARNLIYCLKNNYPECELYLYGREIASVDGYSSYIQVDMTDKESVSKVNVSCDIIFILIGRTRSGNGFKDYDSFIDFNERTLLNLLNECQSKGSHAKIIYPSTRLVYKGKQGLQLEYDEKELKTVYAVNKFACEQYLMQFQHVFGIQYCIFRIGIPYGTLVPGASSYGTAEFMLTKASRKENITLYGDGSVRRTITYIADLCKTLIEGAFSDKCTNDVFNIGGEDYSLKEMAELIATKFRVNIEYIPWPFVAEKIESGDTVFSSKKLESVLGVLTNSRFKDWVNNINSFRRNE